jgi:hypothetical protein
MGSGGAKKTNQMLEQQTQRANAQADVMGGRSAQEYSGKSGLRDQINNQLWSLYGSSPTTTGGRAAGWKGKPYEDIYNRYGEIGNYWKDPSRVSAAYASGIDPIAGMYSGLENSMTRAANATGGYAGFGSQLQSLARQKAREGASAGLQARLGIGREDLAAMEAGAGGQLSTTNSGWQEASSGSAGGPGTQDYYLRALMGQQGQYDDLPYAQLEQGGNAQAAGTIGARRDETPGWQKALMSIGPSALSAGVGAFWPRSKGGNDESYNPYR